ncbi:MAG TPA: SH3 domain-containing protein [Phototrophicaceae bacterium]|nr:SH3 domain-containing protein [Phototrophicaceae bacterium]
MWRFLFLVLPILFQTQTIFVTVTASSAYVRSAPTVDAEVVGSVFGDQQLNAIGRNADGTWLQVEHPAGWINRNEVSSVNLALLPMTDVTTNLLGTSPITDTGFSVTTIDETPLRSDPNRLLATVATIPAYALLPAISRTPDNQWLRVNYRGIDGWVPEYLTHATLPLSSLPLDPQYADDPNYPSVVTISPEEQRAEVDRLQAYLNTYDATAAQAALYWKGIKQGDSLECLPMQVSVPDYSISPQDILAMPELRQMQSLLIQAADDLNYSITLTQNCGILWSVDIQGAYAHAVNARAIFRLINQRLDNVRGRIS